MDLINLQKLSIDDKLSLLRTTGGLQMLQTALSESNSLRKIAEMIEVEPSILYRWKDSYPDIQEAVAPYMRSKTPKTEHIDLSEPLAYRIIYAYEDLRPNIRGCIMTEFDSPLGLWDSIFVQQYFGTFGVYKLSDAECI